MVSLKVRDKSYQLLSKPAIHDLSDSYLQLLLQGDRRSAHQLILQAVHNDVPIKKIYLEVFQWAQRELGYLWETNQITVADEHFCTAVTQSAMAQLYPHLAQNPRKGRTAVITCVQSELHEIGAKMVADYLEMDGWDTYYLGANTPSKDLIEKVIEVKADLLGASITMSHHLPKMIDLVENVKSAYGSNLKVIAGGRPFLISPSLCHSIPGVDGCAIDLEDGVKLANDLMDGEQRP